MRFRPCIDIHNGQVKQIVGGSLRDEGDFAAENFVSGQNAVFYAELYKKSGLKGGHIILLNSAQSPYYKATREQAVQALGAYPKGMQIGGGIHPHNAEGYLEAGASHVIVTSYVFQNGEISWDNLDRMVAAVGKEKLVLDLSCRKKDGRYYVVTDRWQNFTQVEVKEETLKTLCSCCSEFLVHGVDAEGKSQGVERELVEILACHSTIPMTYAGGIGSLADLENLRTWGQDRLDVTVGSALDLFGGSLEYQRVLEMMR